MGLGRSLWHRVWWLFVMAAVPLATLARVQAQTAPQTITPHMDFSQQNLDKWQPRNAIGRIDATPEGAVIEATGAEDPNVVTPPLDFAPNVPLLLRMRARSDHAGSLQIFYFPEGGGASEAASVNLPVRAGVWEDLRAWLPALGPRTCFRVDPVNAHTPGRTVIASLSFQSRDEMLAALTQPRTVQGRVLSNAWHRLVVAPDGTIVSWKARLARNTRDINPQALERTPDLAQRIVWGSADGAALPGRWVWTQSPNALRGVDTRGSRLEIALNGPQLSYGYQPVTPAAAVLRTQVPFFNEGYFDRATGRSLRPDFPPLGGFTTFTSLQSGQIVTTERLKRSLAPVEMNTRGKAFLRMSTPGGFDIVAGGMPLQNAVRFTPDFSSLDIEQAVKVENEHRFTARVEASQSDVTLENGKSIPRFSVTPDRIITNGAGGRFSLNSLLADFYHETAFWWQTGNSGVWSDWTAIEHGFADTPFRDDFRAGLANWIVGDDGYGHDGYAYTWSNQRNWPFPGGVDARHLDSNAVLINAAWRLYCWTGDKSLFTTEFENSRPGADPPTRPGLVPARDTLLGKMRRAMAYQLNWWNGAEEGIIHASGKEGDTWHNGGAKKGVGSNYYDIMPFGGKDAYASVQFYLSLGAMADIEELCGDGSRARYLRGLMPKARQAFSRNFWLEKRGSQDGASRFAGAIDAEGVVHDYGFTFLNTMAMEAGLASPTQANAIYDWLDNGVSVGPKGEKKRDIYSKWQFGARSTTIFNQDWWAYAQGNWPWNDQLQNGGADLYEAGYDIIARARYRGADDAWHRYMAMLTRYAEPDRLSGGGRLWDGSKVQGGEHGAGSVGVMFSEFPECGVASASFLYAFLGITTSAHGLTMTPRVPGDLQSVRARNIAFRGAVFDLEATHDALKIHCTGNPNHKRFFVNGKPFMGLFEVRAPLRPNTSVTLSDSR